MTVGGDLLKAAEANDHAAVDMVSIWGLGHAAERGGSLAPGLWMHGGAQRLLERCNSGVLFNDLAACNAYQNATAAAAGINVTRNPAHDTDLVVVMVHPDERVLPAAVEADRVGQTVGFYQPPNTYINTLDGIYAKTAPLYYCPSDRPGALWQGDIYWRARGNYVINWGHVVYNLSTPSPY